ncbi:MAG: hypothetical protein ABIG95_01775 [Candidatus Woesearchaeota archaeon]
MNILTVLPRHQMMDRVIKDVREAYREDKNNKICYITLNRPHRSVVASIENGVDRFFFVDAITRTVIDNPPFEGNCTFVSSPASFDELLQTVDNLLQKKEYGALVFDSVCTLFSYADTEAVLKFLRKLAIAVDVADCEGVFVAIKPNISAEILDQLGIVTDRTIYLDKD